MIKKIKQYIQTVHPAQRHAYLFIFLLLIFVLIIYMHRFISFMHLRHDTDDQAIPVVTVMEASRTTWEEEFILPGNVRAWHEANIYARTNGYIKTWFVDIGAKVKAGNVLAIIETPEIDAQLKQAEADLKTAEANDHLAQITANRWINLLKTDSVSKQETDERVSNAKATQAIVLSQRANRDRLRELVDFERVIAPFDGVITSRLTDVGSLINAGHGTIPLFHIVQSNRLRIYVRVPQNDATRIQPNMTVTMAFLEHPGKIFKAHLLQTANAIDPITRTLLVEFVADNANGELLPGSYTQIRLILPISAHLIRLPVNTLMFRAAGLQVATVDKDDKIALKPITINRDFGTMVEVSSGIQAGERVIINPSDSALTGQKVRIKQVNQQIRQGIQPV